MCHASVGISHIYGSVTFVIKTCAKLISYWISGRARPPALKRRLRPVLAAPTSADCANWPRPLGEKFVAGVVFYDGETSVSFGNSLFAVPVRCL